MWVDPDDCKCIPIIYKYNDTPRIYCSWGDANWKPQELFLVPVSFFTFEWILVKIVVFLQFIFSSLQWHSFEIVSVPQRPYFTWFYKRDLTAVKANLFLMCMDQCVSFGTATCKHVQTAQTHNPQIKLPVDGTPGQTGNTTSWQQHTQRSWVTLRKPGNRASPRHESLHTSTINEQSRCQCVGLHALTLNSWLNTSWNCGRAFAFIHYIRW